MYDPSIPLSITLFNIQVSDALRSFKPPETEEDEITDNVEELNILLRTSVSEKANFELNDVLFCHQTDTQNVDEGK